MNKKIKEIVRVSECKKTRTEVTKTGNIILHTIKLTKNERYLNMRSMTS